MDLDRMRQLAKSESYTDPPFDDGEAAIAGVERLNELQKALQREAEHISGTPGWQSFGASVLYGSRRMASLDLMANHSDSGIITMDRISIRLTPYKGGSDNPVFDLQIETSRLVRDLKHGQSADHEDHEQKWYGDVQLKKLGPGSLLTPTRKFWKKVQGMKPKAMEGRDMSRMRQLAGIEHTRAGLGESSQVGKTILQQMGGAGRIAAMLGAKNIVLSDNGVSFRWPNKERAKGNAVRITLRPDDTYDMEFLNVSGSSVKTVKKYESIYNDQLVDIFEKQTGWFLSLGGSKKPPMSGRKPGPEVDPSNVTSKGNESGKAAHGNKFWTVSSMDGTFDSLDAAKKAWFSAGKPKGHGSSVWATEHHGEKTIQTVTLNPSMESKLDELREMFSEGHTHVCAAPFCTKGISGDAEYCSKHKHLVPKPKPGSKKEGDSEWGETEGREFSADQLEVMKQEGVNGYKLPFYAHTKLSGHDMWFRATSVLKNGNFSGMQLDSGASGRSSKRAKKASLDAKWASDAWDEVEPDKVPPEVKKALGEEVEDAGSGLEEEDAPLGFKAKPVKLLSRKVEKDPQSAGLQFVLAASIYDAYAKDHLYAVAPGLEASTDILLKGGYSEEEVDSIYKDARSGPVDLPKPVKIKTTVFVRKGFNEAADDIKWKKNVKRQFGYPLDIGDGPHGQYTVHHQTGGKELVRFYPNTINQASDSLGTYDTIDAAYAAVAKHSKKIKSEALEDCDCLPKHEALDESVTDLVSGLRALLDDGGAGGGGAAGGGAAGGAAAGGGDAGGAGAGGDAGASGGAMGGGTGGATPPARPVRRLRAARTATRLSR